MCASRLGLSLLVTLLVRGTVLSGQLVSIRDFVMECRDAMYQAAEAELAGLGDVLDKAKAMIDEMLKGLGKDLSYNELYRDTSDDLTSIIIAISRMRARTAVISASS